MLPDSLGDLTSLTELSLAHTGLTALPDRVGNLTALVRLHLDGNDLTTLPEWDEGVADVG